jgi:hypothetical protein
MPIENRLVDLALGMATTLKIKTGQWRLGRAKDETSSD